MYREIGAGASCGRFISRSMAFTEWIRSSLESISVPSRSKIRARTAGDLASAINFHCNTPFRIVKRSNLTSLMQIPDARALRISNSGRFLSGHFPDARCSRKIEAFHAAYIDTGDPMAQVRPFRAFRYNPERAPFDRVLTQPYDKISPAMQEKYYAADPHNLITIEKGRVLPPDSAQSNVYTRPPPALQAWIDKNVVVQDPAASFCAYTQEYTVPGTDERRTRRGFIGAGKLEDYSAGVVFRHEQTLSGPKADRKEFARGEKQRRRNNLRACPRR